ncbi:MAG: sec-independent protein translocase protein TatB [Thermodesulfobacteriota bacterium]|nr:sec-independent protein translocase protein TatB [Thermodesulfobacteriota bacterium]
MLGIGMPELIVIAVIALIVIGPEKLPGLAKTLGRMFGELKKATSEFKETMEVESKMADVKKAFDGINEKEIIDKAETVNETEELETPSEALDAAADGNSNEKNDADKEVSKGTA